ncbi:C-type lectin domain family 18 member B-like [Ciona intestinalis]
MLIVLILLNLIVVTPTTGSWHQLDGIEYYFEYKAVSEGAANADCKRMNAILAAVKSQRIQDFLVKNIDTTKLTGGPYSFYIGLSRSGPTTLKWSDGTTTDTSVFTYWDGPDDVYDPGKLCVTMGFHVRLNGFKWKIEECSDAHRYICQRSLPTTTAPTTTTAVTTEQITTEVLTSKGITTTQNIRSTTNNSSIGT